MLVIGESVFTFDIFGSNSTADFFFCSLCVPDSDTRSGLTGLALWQSDLLRLSYDDLRLRSDLGTSSSPYPTCLQEA